MNNFYSFVEKRASSLFRCLFLSCVLFLASTDISAADDTKPTQPSENSTASSSEEEAQQLELKLLFSEFLRDYSEFAQEHLMKKKQDMFYDKLTSEYLKILITEVKVRDITNYSDYIDKTKYPETGDKLVAFIKIHENQSAFDFLGDCWRQIDNKKIEEPQSSQFDNKKIEEPQSSQYLLLVGVGIIIGVVGLLGIQKFFFTHENGLVVSPLGDEDEDDENES